MALIAEQTFIDRLAETDRELSSLVRAANELAGRLVGYPDEGEAPADNPPDSDALLSRVGDTAARMSRAIADINRTLDRISRSLPAEPIRAANLSSARPRAMSSAQRFDELDRADKGLVRL